MNNMNTLVNLTPDSWRRLIKDFGLPFTYINEHYAGVACRIMSDLNPNPYVDQLYILSNIGARYPLPEQQSTFFGEVTRVTHEMIDGILGSDGYKEFNSCNLQEMFPVINMGIPSGDVYNINNSGKQYLSVDLKNAAFQMLRLWDTIALATGHPLILGVDINSYEDYIRKFTDDEFVVEYISKCKRLRQVILGKTNPKRLMHMEKYVMQEIAIIEASANIINPERINNDELVYGINYIEDPVVCSFQAWDKVMKVNVGQDGHITTVDFHVDLGVEVFNLQAYNLTQTMVPDTSAIRFYAKDNREELTTDVIHKNPIFKCLPTNVELIAMTHMYGTPGLMHMAETLPVLQDKVIYYQADPSNQLLQWNLQWNIPSIQ